MTFFMRPARPDDLQTLYEMAKLTGGGFTNLPPDRTSLSAKLERTAEALARTEDSMEDELIVLVLENSETGPGNDAPPSRLPTYIDNSDGGRRAVYDSFRRAGINGGR